MECKTNISGVKEVFLLNYVEYERQFYMQDGFEFPEQPKISPLQLYGASATQSYKNFGWEQEFNFKTPNLINDDLLQDFETKEYRAIIVDYFNRGWMLGKENGIVLKSISSGTGSSESEFSGYDISFEGKERRNFFYIEDLTRFRADLVLFLSSSAELSSTNTLTSTQYI